MTNEERTINHNQNNLNEIPLLNISYLGHKGRAELTSRGYNMQEAVAGMQYLIKELNKMKSKDK